MANPSVSIISECFVKQKHASEESKQPCFLSPWDLAMLSVHYIQKGLLFSKPPLMNNQEDDPISSLLTKLKDSLSLTLVHFYPLSGRLKTLKQENPHSYTVFIDCNDSPGAKFIHASIDLTVSDVLSPKDVPIIVQSFFDHDRAVNHEGHTLPLLSIQVTELIDGIFIGCSMNHAVGDGTSYWHFWESWSEIFKADGNNLSISRPPVNKRWFPGSCGPIINLPFNHPDEFISRHEAPILRERFFHFSSEALAKLKAKANAEMNTKKISSLQALSALVWRSVTRARRFPPEQITGCRLAANNRSRLYPPLPRDYFGNSISPIRGAAKVGELLENGLGYSAWLLHRTVIDHDDEVIRGWVNSWIKSPSVYQLAQIFDPYSIMMGSSPRFDMYGNEFGFGKAVGVRSGYANKFDGKISLYPGFEGGGSMDLEVCLLPDHMSRFEGDEEFMEYASILVTS